MADITSAVSTASPAHTTSDSIIMMGVIFRRLLGTSPHIPRSNPDHRSLVAADRHAHLVPAAGSDGGGRVRHEIALAELREDSRERRLQGTGPVLADDANPLVGCQGLLPVRRGCVYKDQSTECA
jgi:hypothetical protein